MFAIFAPTLYGIGLCEVILTGFERHDRNYVYFYYWRQSESNFHNIAPERVLSAVWCVSTKCCYRLMMHTAALFVRAIQTVLAAVAHLRCIHTTK